MVVRDLVKREDIFQETLLTLWQTFDVFDQSRSFGAWGRGIAAKKILQARRHDHRFPVILDPEIIERIREAFDENEGEVPVYERGLRHCLDQLPARARSLLERHYEKRESGRVIAKALGKSEAAIFKNLSRIRQQLAKCLEQYRQQYEQ